MGKSKHATDSSAAAPKTPKKSAGAHKAATFKIPEAMTSCSDSEEETSPSSLANVKSYIKALPTTECIKGLFKEFSMSMKEELSEIKTDMRHIASRIEAIEESTTLLTNHSEHMEKVVQSQSREIYKLKMQLDDLENRSRRNNIRIKGLPESVQDKDIHSVLTQLFNELLQQDGATDLHIERAHRVYRPKNIQAEQPRDVLCYLQSFKTKEEILRKARMVKRIEWEGCDLSFFQDISRLTLYARSLLQPITRELRGKNIKYRWLFPFGLLFSYQNKSYTIRSPEDIPPVLHKLDLGDITIKDWTLTDEADAAFPELPPLDPWQRATPIQTRRQKVIEKIPPRTPHKSQRIPAGE